MSVRMNGSKWQISFMKTGIGLEDFLSYLGQIMFINWPPMNKLPKKNTKGVQKLSVKLISLSFLNMRHPITLSAPKNSLVFPASAKYNWLNALH